MTSPCRTCPLCASDKNNPTCMQCSKRVRYVSSLDRDLGFASSRSGLETPTPRYPLVVNRLCGACAYPETA